MTSSGDRDWQTQSNTTLIQSSLDALDQGVTVFDADLKLVFAHRAFLELRDLPPYLGKVGTRFEEQVRYRAERGDYGPGDVDGLVRVPHPVSWTQVCHAAGLTDLAAFHFSLARLGLRKPFFSTSHWALYRCTN